MLATTSENLIDPQIRHDILAHIRRTIIVSEIVLEETQQKNATVDKMLNELIQQSQALHQRVEKLFEALQKN